MSTHGSNAGRSGAAGADKAAATRVGMVESDSRDKTRKVVVPNDSIHPKYGKIMRGRTVLHVHDETNQSRRGDLVEVVQCRPVSKTKRWKLVRVVQKEAGSAFTAVEAPGQTGA
ncbi:MAG: 30S ribosomal protein S17 [Planctomyces sp.]|nr:30S ribosomal protein S17 [Planctomyces sp.]MBA4119414.1 30S ribosomal protein S17 [Isosphaera sp.]